MYTIETAQGVVDISNELFEKYKSRLEKGETIDEKLRSNATIDLRAVKYVVSTRGFQAPRTIRMLDSHCGSDSDNNIYVYFDTGPEDPKLVSNWVEEYDGRFDCLYLSGCNKGKVRLSPKMSLIVYPLGENTGKQIFLAAIGLGMSNLVIASPINRGKR